MVKDSSHLPLGARIAVVEEVRPGCDGLVQVATIKTMVGSTRCPIHMLVILPSKS